MPTSKKSRYFPLPFNKVQVQDTFWGPRIATNAKTTLYSQLQHLNDTGRLPAFRMDWKPGEPNEPHIFWDSDVAKWIEGACYSLQVCPDSELMKLLDSAVDLVISAQQPDGYLNVHYTLVEPDKRWSNLRDCHELYCAGHLIEAAVAHFRTTGETKMLQAMCRYADYIDTVFGPEPEKKKGYSGHPEIELALIKLYEVTGNDKYLRLSEYFLEERGRQPYYFDKEAIERGEQLCQPDQLPIHMRADTRYEYTQADVPIREQTKVAGHAVRAMYIYSAAADLAGINEDTELYSVLKSLLDSLITRRMYITGGIGPCASNEGFTTDYDLPNLTAYAETCAAIGLIMWSHRMLRFELNSKYSDVLERALYNGSISGISLSGDKYFYENPLASAGNHHRVDWFGCSCCPTNIVRLIPSVGGYIYSNSESGVAVHLYIQSTADMEIASGALKIEQKTNYPWEGSVELTVHLDKPAQFSLNCRIPGWAESFQARVNGAVVESSTVENGYLQIRRQWNSGDTLELDFPMPVRQMFAHPDVKDDIGKVAVQRGPLVYCLEQVDNISALHRIYLLEQADFVSSFEPDLLNGVVTIGADALQVEDPDEGQELYSDKPAPLAESSIKAIPYYAWDNREPGAMLVWLNIK